MSTPQWFLDQLAFAGPEHLDAEYVSGYDRKTGVDPADDLALLRDLGPSDDYTLIDLGAGTSALPLIAAPHCRRVVAVDVSAQMLAHLTQTAERSGIDNIECVQAGFLTYEHHGDPADVVYSRHALHHLPDFWKVIALRRIAAMLKPGGVFHLRDLIYSVDPDDVEQVIESWLSNASVHPGVGWSHAELETHVREEYSTFSWLLEPMLERAGFRIQDVYDADSKTYLAYTCIKAS